MADLKRVMVITAGLGVNDVNFIRSYTRILADLADLTLTRCDAEDRGGRDAEYRQIFIRFGTRSGLLGKVAASMAMQLRVAWRLLAEPRMDAYIFFLSESLFVPIAVARLTGRRAVIAPGSSAWRLFASRRASADRLVMYMERLGYRFCDRVVLYSDRLVDEWGLGPYRDKVTVCPRHYVGEEFSVTRDPADRGCVVGYVGRLSSEKGVLNLVHAVPAVLDDVPDARFRLVGDGELRPEIEAFVHAHDLAGRVGLCGWTDHSRLPAALNDLKVLALPSETEGLPNVVLEAMACGVVVIASPVGAVPDLIAEGRTGFLLDGRDSSSIAAKVVEVLRRNDLAEISANASAFIEEQYRFGPAQERYRALLDTITARS